ncbi:hypothetical protein [Peribacillus kribbensis]|uniref:hypothetical protein n=1 Tax=Peribacillus kribbensis TaxID=356658 RepID=UPI000420FF2A|nr:hypothetical protein [Peribacillus kribbensis]
MNSEEEQKEIILLELDSDSWKRYIDSIEEWLEGVLAVQNYLSSLVKNTALRIQEPHIREAVKKMSLTQENHMKSVMDLFEIIGRKPSPINMAAGFAVSKMEEGLANLKDFLGGGTGVWRDLHYLILANQQAVSAFSISEQLALSEASKKSWKSPGRLSMIKPPAIYYYRNTCLKWCLYLYYINILFNAYRGGDHHQEKKASAGIRHPGRNLYSAHCHQIKGTNGGTWSFPGRDGRSSSISRSAGRSRLCLQYGSVASDNVGRCFVTSDSNSDVSHRNRIIAYHPAQ